jgi:choloylglycine hydrolase
MRKYIIILIFIIINSLNGFTCTTFIIKTANELVFGRNLDWFSDNGIIVVNKRNINKTSLVFPPEKPIEWLSKYGSITFNQFGKEFPFGGINEKGLVIEIMVAKAQYENFDDRKAVNELQWIQYQLDNSKTIDDVINSKKFLRISSIDQNLHYLICDSSGNRAVIEFQNNSMIVYKDENLPISVLENDLYSKSLMNYKRNFDCRFTTATNMIKNYNTKTNSSIIDYSFKILDRVALSAEWSIVYDIKNMKIHFKTSSNQEIQEININLFNFDCTTESLMYDLLTKNSGNINSKFSAFTSKINEDKLRYAIKSNNIDMPESILKKFYNYHKECKCME